MGKLNNEVDFNPSGTTYQLEKFYKHTVPPVSLKTISIFEMSNNKKYKEYFVNTLASGCLELDDGGRENIIWVAGKKQGYLFKNGVLQGDVDGVKIVLPYDPNKIHAFPAGSSSLKTITCINCGQKIIH